MVHMQQLHLSQYGKSPTSPVSTWLLVLAHQHDLNIHATTVTLTKVLYVPTIKVNLVSIAAVLEQNIFILVCPVTRAVNFTRYGKTIATGSVLRNTFWLDVNKPVAYTAATDAGVIQHECQ